MIETTYLEGKVLKRSLPVFHHPPLVNATGPKRLLLQQGELAHFYDGQQGLRYVAFIELRQGAVRGNHWHNTKEEQIYVISGELLLVAQDRDSGSQVAVNLKSGDLATIAPGVAHALKTVQAGQAIEFATTQFDAADTQRITLI